MPRCTACRQGSMKSANAILPAPPRAPVVPLRRDGGRHEAELAFLPAALEIVETPPSPTGRAIAGCIMLLCCGALAWTAWGTVDMVASATGRIVTSGGSQTVQPFETGVVRAIHVEDGQAVKA